MNDITAKEKAKQLIFEFYDVFKHKYPMDRAMSFAKECALKHANEILSNFGNLADGKQHYAAYSTITFYEQVKTEIENYE